MTRPSLILLPPTSVEPLGKTKVIKRGKGPKKGAARRYRRTKPHNSQVPTGYDQVLHIRYRLFLQDLLGIKVLAVYDTLRSLIWRQDDYGIDALRCAANQGFLAAKSTERELSKISGVTREKVKECLQRLVALGWITPYVPSAPQKPFDLPFGVKVWELGLRVCHGGVWTESLYATGQQELWYAAADARSQERWGLPYRKTSPQTQKETSSDTLIALQMIPAPKTPAPRRKSAAGIPMTQEAMVEYAARFEGLSVDPRVYGPEAPHLDPEAWMLAPLMAEETNSIDSAFMFGDALSEAANYRSGTIRSAESPKIERKTENVTLEESRAYNDEANELSGRNHATMWPESCHLEWSETTESQRVSADLGPIQETTIDSSLRMTFPTGKVFHTSYESLSPSGKSSDPSAPKEAKAKTGAGFARPASALAAFVRLRTEIEVGSASPPDDSLPEQTPKPQVPLAPLSPVGENWPDPVTDSGDCPRNEETSVTPPNRSRASDPAQPPADPPNAAAEALTGAGEALPVVRPDLTSVLSVIEVAKARSRAAIEVKLQKARSRERKKENLTSDKAYRSQKPAAQNIEKAWREEMLQAFPDVPLIAWFKREQGKLLARKEGKLIADLLDGYGGDEAVVENLVRGFVVHWDKFGPLLTKTKDGVPTIGLLYACHASVMVELRRLVKTPMNHVEYADWLASMKHDPFAVPPPELLATHKAAKAGAKK